ncbi:type VII secretion-associated serine protease mycosin [Amycolatopsis thailandensis]|uniref:Type VII secretion-associated serine protease mycosin n=1 Tax=Amycolatopsis thailandensis TaxID=589330 RepID=A0A229SER9_9PSEU|nr:type VII secretion-associated serine protease mycosin [Amycolatopsis thailandensis]OXM57325.1 type VII secretion-associated serine protease mycosin [Amycolatopsis thailandensis]
MRRHRVPAVAAVVAATAVQALLGAGTAHAAPPPGACPDPEPARPPVRAQPWAQQALAPQQAWPSSRGAGVLVAVVDSGVDADHPQLARPGKVRAGRDFYLKGTLPGAFDCVSHGTGVASIIAADPAPGVGFHGIAPDAEILPVRISDRDVGGQGESLRIDPQVVANGIRYAADEGAKVINLSLAGHEDFAVIRNAVAYAVSRDALVVAAAGNAQRDTSTELPSYPAAYDGVLGVGAIDIDGARLSGSQIGRYVDIVAPGVKVLTSARAGGHLYADGTSYATPFVSGTAALVRSAWPALSAPEVARRLMATASPARGGAGSPAYGAGVVAPYRAVSDGMDVGKPGALPAFVPPPPDQERIDRAAELAKTSTTAKVLAVALVAVLVLAVVLAVLLPRGRARGWRAGRANTVAAEPAVIEPPEQIFLISGK